MLILWGYTYRGRRYAHHYDGHPLKPERYKANINVHQNNDTKTQIATLSNCKTEIQSDVYIYLDFFIWVRYNCYINQGDKYTTLQVAYFFCCCQRIMVCYIINPFLPDGISHRYQLDKSNSNIRVVG